MYGHESSLLSRTALKSTNVVPRYSRTSDIPMKRCKTGVMPGQSDAGCMENEFCRKVSFRITMAQKTIWSRGEDLGSVMLEIESPACRSGSNVVTKNLRINISYCIV